MGVYGNDGFSCFDNLESKDQWYLNSTRGQQYLDGLQSCSRHVNELYTLYCAHEWKPRCVEPLQCVGTIKYNLLVSFFLHLFKAKFRAHSSNRFAEDGHRGRHPQYMFGKLSWPIKNIRN